MRPRLVEDLITLARNDDKMWLVYADVGYGHLDRFVSEFPDRSINVGIREQLAVGVAAGLALEGYRPYVYAMATFLTRRAFEQIAVDVANPDLPVTLIGIGGGLCYQDAGYAHYPSEDVEIMSRLPNMTTSNPLTVTQLDHDLYTARRPLYMRVGEYKE